MTKKKKQYEPVFKNGVFVPSRWRTLKQQDITNENVDEYIWQQKLAGKKFINWTNVKAIKIFRDFGRIVFGDIGIKLPKSFPHEQTFLGIKHFVKKKTDENH